MFLTSSGPFIFIPMGFMEITSGHLLSAVSFSPLFPLLLDTSSLAPGRPHPMSGNSPVASLCVLHAQKAPRGLGAFPGWLLIHEPVRWRSAPCSDSCGYSPTSTSCVSPGLSRRADTYTIPGLGHWLLVLK